MEEKKQSSSQTNSEVLTPSSLVVRQTSLNLERSPKVTTFPQEQKKEEINTECQITQENEQKKQINEEAQAEKAPLQTQNERKTTSSSQRVKFIVFGGNSQTFLTTILKRLRPKWVEVSGEHNVESCAFIWKPTHMTPIMADQVFRGERLKVYNHIENIRGLTTKNGLVKSLKHYYKDERTAREIRYTAWETMPTSFLLAAQNVDFEYKQFCQRFKELAQGYSTRERMPMKHCEKNMWLVKPAAMNQGRGIEIFKNLIDIQTFINSKTLNSHFIVQKYLERPLLYRNYKFDIRVWAIITSKNELLFFKRGYLRLSSFQYSINPADLSVHLTNQMLQKKFNDYGKVYQGNAISFEDFEDYLNELFPENKVGQSQFQIDVEEHIVKRMKDLIIDSFLSVKKNLNPQK